MRFKVLPQHRFLVHQSLPHTWEALGRSLSKAVFRDSVASPLVGGILRMYDLYSYRNFDTTVFFVAFLIFIMDYRYLLHPRPVLVPLISSNLSPIISPFFIADVLISICPVK